MATSSNRDVRLGVEIQAAGEENLQRLAAEVRALAKAGGDAAPKYLELASELERVAVQARELDAFRKAAVGIDEAAAATKRATENAERLRVEYAKQTEVTEAVRAAQARIREELDRTKLSIAGQVQQQALLKVAMKGATDDSGAFALASTELATGLANLKKRQADLNVELSQAGQNTKAANTALRDLGDASEKAAGNAQRLQQALRDQAAAMETARAAGEKLGADFRDVAAAQERLDASLRGGVAALTANAAASREKADADRLLALEARGLAEAAERAQLAVRSELAAIKESEQFSQRFEQSQRETAAAVEKLTDDLDRQAATVRGSLITSMNAAAAAYEQEQAAILETITKTERLAAARLEQADSDRLAAAQVRGLADARERANVVAQSELAAIKESEQFTRQFEKSQRDTAAAVQALTDDLDRQAALVQGRLVKSLAEAAAGYDRAEKEAEQAAVAANRVNGYFEKLANQRDVLKNAFGTTGVRSIQAIEQEMFKLSQALVTLRGEFAKGDITITDFERATASAKVKLAQLKAEIATIPGQTSAFEGLANSVNGMITKFGALTAAVATVGLAVKPVVDSFISLQATTRILTQVTGSAAEAAKQIEFLRNTAKQSGQSFSDVSQSYAKFAASALQAGLSTQQVQAAFKAVSLAAGNLGLSSDQAKRALEALSQMASKGSVTMEELRQQLGDALPGALPLLAAELGLTGKELNKLVESGGLLAVDAIPAITASLAKMAPASGVVKGLAAEFARFKDTLLEAGTTLIEGPLGTSLGFVLEKVSGALKALAFVAVSASEGLTFIGKTALLVTDVFRGNIKSTKEFTTALSDFAIESGAKIDAFRVRAGIAGDALNEVAATTQVATAQAAASTEKLGVATQQAGQAAVSAAPQHAAAATAIAGVGTAAANTSTLLPKLAVDYLANSEAANATVASATKLALAAKDEGDALKELASLVGTDTEAKLASAKAADLRAAAEARVAEAQRVSIGVLEAQRAATVAQATAEGKSAQAISELVAAIDKKILAQTADVEKAEQTARSFEVQAIAARLAADAVADNTFRYSEFRLAAQAAQEQVDLVRRQMDRGYATTKDLERATDALSLAQGRLKDSILDTDKALAATLTRKKAEVDVAKSSIQIKIEEQKALQRFAELHGLEGQALQAKIRIKELELQQANLAVTAKAAEAAETIRVTEQTIRESDALGILTPELRAVYELRLLNAKAMAGEARAAEIGNKQKAAEIELLKRLRIEKAPSPTSAPSPGSPSGGPNAPAGGINANRKQLPPGVTQQEVDDDPYGRSADQIYSLKQQGGPVDNSYIFDVRSRLNSGGTFSPDEAPALRNALRVAEANARAITGSSVQGLNGNRDAAAWVQVMRRAVEAAEQAAAIAAPASASGPSLNGAGGTSAFGSEAVRQATRTININLAGLGSTSINVASDADAAKVEALLRQIEQSMGRAGG